MRRHVVFGRSIIAGRSIVPVRSASATRVNGYHPAMPHAEPQGIATAERWLLPALARYFRLELRGKAAEIPDWKREPCLFVMNHTALLGLEVWLLFAALRQLRPDAPRPRATVWPPFLGVPLLGPFYRAAGCMPMTVAGAADALREGESVLVLP